MPRCITPGCGSYAINHGSHGRDGSDGDLCDVCYWRKRAGGFAEAAARPTATKREPLRGTLWTVARFPNGTWATGGKPADAEYAECEVFQVRAYSRKKATKLAQGRWYRQRKAQERADAPR